MPLNKTFAEEFASLLDAALPELGVAARPDRPALEQRRCFSFQVPCPSVAVASPLSVFVTPNYVTVEFLTARNHFADPHEAVTLICELLEETVIVEVWTGPDLRDCAFVNVNALPTGRINLPGVTRIVRQSWRDKYVAGKNWAKPD